MKALVIGRGGQLSACIDELAAPGMALTSVGLPELDLRDEQAIRGLAPPDVDVVINAAAYTAVDKAEEEAELAFAINAKAVGALAREAWRVNAPFIHVSTDYVFSGFEEGARREDFAAAPRSVYGASKLQGEKLALAANPLTLVLRTSWLYSAYGANFVKTMLRLAGERKSVRVVADQIGCPTSAHEFAGVVMGVAERIGSPSRRGVFGVFHAAADGACSWADLAERVFETSRALGGPYAAVERISTAEYPTRAARPMNSALCCEKLAMTYGLRMRPWREGVDDVVRRTSTA